MAAFPDGECEVAIRPEAIELHDDGMPRSARRCARRPTSGQLMEYTLDTKRGKCSIGPLAS
jgi:hypothetical protein